MTKINLIHGTKAYLAIGTIHHTLELMNKQRELLRQIEIQLLIKLGQYEPKAPKTRRILYDKLRLGS